MWVKMLDGRFAGEVRDLRSDVAMEFIRQKRAERAFADPEPIAAATTPFALIEDAPARGPKPAKADRKKPSK
jgi:hypothetical protein